ncbi:MAG: replicative DNA helicase, partial [Acidobacteriota bacterium]|nr:replicative DNA helicase [Acidobacteriota bacterium]
MPAETTIERPLPHYLVAEKTLLGVVLLNNAALVGALEKGLTSDDFFLPEHRNVFDAMMQLDEGRKPIDAVTVT